MINDESNGVMNVNENSDLSESLKQLNDDTTDTITRMSGIDLRARLNSSESPSILACDTLVSFNFLPQECLNFTRQKKRLSVSLDGKGRDEIVHIVSGRREEESGQNLKDRIKGFFGGKPQ